MHMGQNRRIASGLLATSSSAAGLVISMMWPSIPEAVGWPLLGLCGAGFIAALILYLSRDKETRAAENPSVTYVTTNNITHIHYHGSPPPGPGALVRFKTGGTPAILDAQNVSSISDNGAGDFTINFAKPFGSADYAVQALGDNAEQKFLVARSPGSIRLTYPGGEPTEVSFRIFQVGPTA